MPRTLAVLWHNLVPVTPATACCLSASPAKLVLASWPCSLHKQTVHLRKNKEPLVKGVKQKPETKKINSGSWKCHSAKTKSTEFLRQPKRNTVVSVTVPSARLQVLEICQRKAVYLIKIQLLLLAQWFHTIAFGYKTFSKVLQRCKLQELLSDVSVWDLISEPKLKLLGNFA